MRQLLAFVKRCTQALVCKTKGGGGGKDKHLERVL
jgi:hypothetical protein